MKEKLKNRIKKQTEDFLFSDTVSVTATKFLLMFIGIGAISIVGATLPGLVKMIGLFNRDGRKFKKKYPREKVRRSLSYLKHKKLIEIIKEKNGKLLVKLTNKGKNRLAEYSIDTVGIKKPEKWDGKWRILMFDIPVHPNRYNYARNALRNKVKELGFCQIQKSVWVYPYECEDELLFIAEMFKVQNYIEIMTAEKILHEESLRKKFSFL